MLAFAHLASAAPPRPESSPSCRDAMDCDHDRPEGHAPASDLEQQDPAEFRLQVDFFRKLGYSQREVRSALRKLGLSADTNTVLGELIRHQADRESQGSPPSPPAPAQGPVLVPRGGSSVRTPGGSLSTTPPPPVEEELGEGAGLLKPIVIDGSNVAMSHGNKEVFSCQGIQLAVNYFLDRGHSDITVFVPSWRKEQPRPDVPITDQQILRDLEKKKIVVFTPSRRVGGKRVVCYDDRFIVKLAQESGGIIVSNDTYRDLQSERPEWKRCVEEQLLMYSFVNDKFMPPDDPLGRHGPSLENFLRKKPLVPEHKRQPCPYGKKCTYGIKCKFYHQDRGHHSQRSLADELRANAKLSALKEDRKSTPPRKSPHGDPIYLSLDQDLEQRLILEQWGSLKASHVSENVLLHRDRGAGGGHPGRRPASKMAVTNHEWTNHHHSPLSADSTFLQSSQERLDSGLGSYESQYSEASRGHGDPHGAGPGPPSSPSSSSSSSGSLQRYLHSSHPERQDGRQPCSCCSHQVPPACLQHYSQGLSSCQPCYAPFGGPLHYPVPPHYSLPATFSQVHLNQQKYWSDPYHVVPLTHQGFMGAFRDQRTWAPHPSRQAPFDAEREEVRKKLQAIFHPYQVDKVMGMFPHVLDPQALAAEILTLKSQGGVL
ncbi:hypothetical protein AAFF_G00330090 [Aldrovandia affinis]|uniref:C3H1-type domain-containing protein n=1 Tax=Aldrovandia affinis TaxID=143900 RepID=A0AAD7WQB8_9TELE|nr:hypothetical protein AAFF_G00330090 [Aldrovandia affinis]